VIPTIIVQLYLGKNIINSFVDFQVDAYGVSVNDATFLASDPEVSFLSDANITFSVPMHNDMPLNPMDISLAQQTPTQQLVKTFSRKSIKKYLPKALYSNLPRSCNDTNLVSESLRRGR